MSCAETVELIEVWFGCGLGWAKPRLAVDKKFRIHIIMHVHIHGYPYPRQAWPSR